MNLETLLEHKAVATLFHYWCNGFHSKWVLWVELIPPDTIVLNSEFFPSSRQLLFLPYMTIWLNLPYYLPLSGAANSAGGVEYTDCISAEG